VELMIRPAEPALVPQPPAPAEPAEPAEDPGSAAPAGDAAPVGPQGDTAPAGDAGSAGPQGDAAPAGDAGPAGDAAPAGDAGPTGPQVDAGPAESAMAEEPQGHQGPQTRRVVVVPLHDERRLRYQDWVAGRRQFVRARSDGRIGYLHVPDMMGEGWAHLHRDLRAEMGRDALIVDVRGNRGGHTSQLIVEKLARRIIGWDFGRWLRPESYPGEAPRGPVVALADEFAGSDGDIVTAAIRSLRLGPVVGARTWGGVVGIDGGGHDLVDGTRITVPRYAFWFSEYGWDVENHGVDPEVEVLITPDDWAAGRDPQLEVAVDRALALLADNPPAPLPDVAAGPAKARPPLPPRP
jgi:tricorn protease